MNIIILADNHHNALGLIRSAGIAGFKVYVILNSKDGNFVDKSKFVSNCIYIHNESEIIPAITDLCTGIEMPFLLSSSEDFAAFVDKNQDILSKYCHIEGGKQNDAIQKFRSKAEANKLAEEVGFEIPKSLVVEYENRSELPTDIEYPVIVKASESVGGWKSAMKKCMTKQELESHLSSIDRRLFPLVIQQFIEYEYEMMYVGCSIDDGGIVFAPIGHKKIRRYPDNNGLVSYSESFYTADEYEVCKLIEKSSLFLSKIHYTGMFSAEFVVSNGHYYYLETNLRNDATSIISTRCGYDLVSIYCNYLLNNFIKISKKDYIPRHYMNVVSDIHHMLRGNINPIKWLWQLISAGAYPYFYSSDLKPTIYYIYYLIKNKFSNE